eukprot:scaffold110074_cov48-Phaeocystis_antarctica.AAC.1
MTSLSLMCSRRSQSRFCRTAPGDLEVAGRHGRWGWQRWWRRRGERADALLGRGARASAAATPDVEGGGRVQDAARWMTVKRRGGGLAPALGRDESATAGAALDHIVAPGDLEVAGRHGRRGWRRRRQRWRRRRWWCGRGRWW